MNIREMHYAFKKGFNKIDSQQNRNLLVPEIDWTLNQAESLFKRMVINPRKFSHLGFEVNQRTIDDIRTIVVPEEVIIPVNNILLLPGNYDTYVRARATLTKGTCTTKAKVHIKQHDDEFEESPFDSSSFEWKEVNAVFDERGIHLYTDNTFTIDNVSLTYIRQTAYMHNAQDFPGGTYLLPGSEVAFTGSQDCELPTQTHPDIVDIAVLLASAEVQTSDFQLRLAKLNLNQIT